MKKFTFLYIGFFLSFAILVILSINYFKRLELLDENIRQVERSQQLLQAMEEISSTLFINGTHLRDMVLLNDPSYWPNIMVDNTHLLERINQLSQSLLLDTSQKKRIMDIEALLQRRFQVIRDSVLPFRYQKVQNQRDLHIHLKSFLDSFQQLHFDFMVEESSKLRLIQRGRTQQAKLTDPLLILMLSFSGLMISSIFIYLMITLRRRLHLQQELQMKIETLNMANAELENLSRVASHHIQEPMRKIRNFASLIRKRIKDIPREEVSNIVAKIELNAGSLQLLAQNLARYGNLIIDHRSMEKVDLNVLIDDVIYRLDDVIYEKQATVHHEKLPLINGIPYQLFLLFHELIKNSIQFAKPGTTPVVDIYSAETEDPTIIRIIVSDKGIGFGAEYNERIFRIFEKLEPGSSNGKGIGLAICSRIMVNHSGSIRASGDPANGTNIILDFPRPS